MAISLYNSEWVHCSLDYKKMVLFIIGNMQTDMTISVRGLVTFSLKTFLTVMRSLKNVHRFAINMSFL